MEPTTPPPAKQSRAGRNLPASIGVAIVLIAIIVASLVFGRKAADPVTSGPDGPPASTQGATNPAPSR